MELCAKVQAAVTVFVSVGGFCKAVLVLEDSFNGGGQRETSIIWLCAYVMNLKLLCIVPKHK